jgi:hypothetical protein
MKAALHPPLLPVLPEPQLLSQQGGISAPHQYKLKHDSGNVFFIYFASFTT